MFARSVLQDGNCGAWAVDVSSVQVYGHIVASDALEEIYVVPMDATLRDIKLKLPAEKVCLPTRDDMTEWTHEHVEVNCVTAGAAEPALMHIRASGGRSRQQETNSTDSHTSGLVGFQ